MRVPATTFRQWVDRGIGSAVPLLVVLLAVVALPECPRVAGMATSEDTFTITELRPVTQTFTRPGHYLLHQTGTVQDTCATCDDHVDQNQPQSVSQTVVTVDVLPRAAGALIQFGNADIVGLPGSATTTLPAGYISSVPSPPPQAA